MPLKKLLLIAALLSVTLFVVAAFATPILFRIWIDWTLRGQHVEITWRDIHARLLQPIILYDVKVRSSSAAPGFGSIEIGRAEFDLRLIALLDATRGRALRHLKLEGVRGDIREKANVNAAESRDLSAWRRLIADNFTVIFDRLRIARGDVSFELQDASLSASELEAGRFTARSLSLNTPWFQKAFTNLRGATSWEYEHLTIGAITLLPGLDLDAITFDLARIGEDRVGIDASLDAFGGKLRASTSSAFHSTDHAWEVAGTATQISLAQLSDAFDFSRRASGTLRSSKFTFRGDLANIADSTASVWTEIEGFTWGDRTADTIMVGASLSGREIQIEQIYVKQRENQLTLTGESALPREPSEWPDFRGDVSASIKDLGEFARLFGGKPAQFSGEITVNGDITEREHQLGGQLVASGSSLTLFGAPVDTLSGKFNLKESAVRIEQCELHHGSDFATATGSLELGSGHRYAGHFAASISDLAPYARLLEWAGDYLQPEGSIAVEGEAEAGSPTGAGTFRARGQALRLSTPASLLPFDAQFEGNYSADKIFFQKFSLRNQRAAFNTFATIASDYVQLQSIRFEADGKPVLEGHAYVPVTVSIPSENGRWFTAFIGDSAYDVDLRLAAANLAEVASAFSTRRDLAGKLEGQLQIYGTTEAPEARLLLHARDFVSGDAAGLGADLEASLSATVFSLKTNLSPRGLAPMQFDCSLPFEFDENTGAYRVRSDAPFTASATVPGIDLTRLPAFLTAGLFDRGTVRAKVTASGSWPNPRAEGDAEFTHLSRRADRYLDARLLFEGATAKLPAARLTDQSVSIPFSGELDFIDANATTLKLHSEMLVSFSPPPECVQEVTLTRAEVTGERVIQTDRLELSGPLFRPGWTLSAAQSPLETPVLFCTDHHGTGEALTLQVTPNK